RVLGVEALVHWHHPQRGRLRPDEFLPYAEPTGLMAQLDGWVLATAAAQIAAWPTLYLSVNVSAAAINQADFLHHLQDVLRTSGLPPARLRLELSEQTLHSHTELCPALGSLGVGLTLDDFGTGSNCLGRLSTWPVTALKIDCGLISQIEQQPASQRLVQAIIVLAQNLGITPIATGVETHEQKTALQQLGCAALQGNALVPPLSAAALRAYLTLHTKSASTEEAT
ncbi:MAG: EAL domain-containing protein, partial [Gloeomargarita sp. DG_1_6_bins_138]